MHVIEGREAGKYEYKGQMYYFCSQGCYEQFKANPEAYLGRARYPIGAAEAKAEARGEKPEATPGGRAKSEARGEKLDKSECKGQNAR